MKKAGCGKAFAVYKLELCDIAEVRSCNEKEEEIELEKDITDLVPTIERKLVVDKDQPIECPLNSSMNKYLEFSLKKKSITPYNIEDEECNKIEEETTFSKKVINEYRNPTNFGFIKNPDASGKIKGPCGDTMRIDLKIKDNKISDVRFWTDGCGASIACGNMLTKMITEKTIQEAKNITSAELLFALDGLPLEHQHCSVLAINTLNKSLGDYNKRKRREK
jgi:nitrogen fixation NifU-like protein